MTRDTKMALKDWKGMGAALCLAVLLTGCAGPVEPRGKMIATATQVAVDTPLVARYETFHDTHGKPQTWWYLRRAHRIEKRIPQLGRAWIWTHHHDHLTMQQVLLREKRVIDYTTADLKSIRNHPEWKTLRHMLDPHLLSRLKRGTKTQVMGHPAVRYEGVIESTKLKILWLEDLRLPAEITRSHRGQTSRIRLTALYPEAQSPIQPIKLDDFEHMDFADLGDNEADPLWSRLAHPH